MNRADICPACGHPGRADNPLTEVPPIFPGEPPARIHRSHVEDPRSGFYAGVRPPKLRLPVWYCPLGECGRQLGFSQMYLTQHGEVVCLWCALDEQKAGHGRALRPLHWVDGPEGRPIAPDARFGEPIGKDETIKLLLRLGAEWKESPHA